MKLFQKSYWFMLTLSLLILSACGSPNPGSQQAGSEGPTSSQSEWDGQKSEPGRSDGTESSSVQPAVPVGLMGKSESVEDDWFADAVFVGDSRTDGLKLYSGIKSAAFISHQGLSVFNISSKECIDTDDGMVTAITALGQRQWAKVYLMLGVNELGYNAESFREAFTSVVEQIKACQPNATVYLQTILPVNEEIAEQKGLSSAITNERVILFNGIIEEIADSEGTALVDVAAAFWTEAGEMAADNTRDGVHLTRQGYVAWYEYLKSHTGTTQPLEEPGTHIYIPANRPAKRPPVTGPEEKGEPEPPLLEEAEEPQETEELEKPNGPPPEESAVPPDGTDVQPENADEVQEILNTQQS